MSRKPWVVISPQRLSLRSRSALVVTVVPWMMAATCFEGGCRVVQCYEHAGRLVRGSRGHLGEPDSAPLFRLHEDQVGEGPADIHADDRATHETLMRRRRRRLPTGASVRASPWSARRAESISLVALHRSAPLQDRRPTPRTLACAGSRPTATVTSRIRRGRSPRGEHNGPVRARWRDGRRITALAINVAAASAAAAVSASTVTASAIPKRERAPAPAGGRHATREDPQR